MRRIGIRALKQNASAVVSEVAAGEIVTVTDRGRAVAQLVPMGGGILDRLIASGRARPARRTMSSLDRPVPKSRREGGLSKVLSEMRKGERY